MIVGYSPTALDTVNFFLLCAATHRIRYATHLKLFHRIIIGNCRLLLNRVILRLKKVTHYPAVVKKSNKILANYRDKF